MFVSRIKNQAQGMTLFILALGILVAIFFINLIIKKNIANDKERLVITSASSAIQQEASSQEDINPPVSPQNDTLMPSNSQPKKPNSPNKEIIYEPSIKGDLLIQ